MILTQDNEYTVLIDACVLVPMPLCDTLLRLAEEPAMYRPLWSEEILGEVGRVLHQQLGYTEQQSARRIEFMKQAFPEAAIATPAGFHESLTGIPDKNDCHVLGAAICGHAHAIVTRNTKHFPKDAVQPFDILCQTPDDFLIHQFHLRSCPNFGKA